MKKEFVLPSSLLIDPTAEPLKEILSPYRGITHVPSELSGPGLMVFIELQKCFKKANRVCEGLLANILWGFEECGYETHHVAAGLTQLRMLKYIYYSDAGGLTFSEIAVNPKAQLWIRYGKKMLDLLVKNEHEGVIFTDAR